MNKEKDIVPAIIAKTQDELKRLAGETAAQQVQSGMVVGLGFGSTAIHALWAIGAKIQSGELQDVLGVPTADSIARDAASAGIPLTSLEENPEIDIKKLARDVGLDEKNLTRAFYKRKVRYRLKKDILDGVKMGIRGTPSFVIDGEVYQGQIPPEILKWVLE